MHLSTFFSIIDSNNSKDLSRQEFVLAIGNSGLINMESNEINTLFDKLDQNRDGKINFGEMLELFSQINTEMIIKKLQQITS